MPTVMCPGCNRRIEFSDDQAGGVGQCPKCHQRFRIPAVKQGGKSSKPESQPAVKQTAKSSKPESPPGAKPAPPKEIENPNVIKFQEDVPAVPALSKERKKKKKRIRYEEDDWRSRPSSGSGMTRNRIVGGFGVLFGLFILGGGAITGAHGAYAAGQMIALVFGAVMLIAGVYYLIKG